MTRDVRARRVVCQCISQAFVQEEWDAIPHEAPARPSAAATAAAAAAGSGSSGAAAAAADAAPISYEEAAAALAAAGVCVYACMRVCVCVCANTAADMSSQAQLAVVYEPPSSCFGRLLHCFQRPQLHVRNPQPLGLQD